MKRKRWTPKRRISPKNLSRHIEPELGQLTPTRRPRFHRKLKKKTETRESKREYYKLKTLITPRLSGRSTTKFWNTLVMFVKKVQLICRAAIFILSMNLGLNCAVHRLLDHPSIIHGRVIMRQIFLIRYNLAKFKSQPISKKDRRS